MRKSPYTLFLCCLLLMCSIAVIAIQSRKRSPVPPSPVKTVRLQEAFVKDRFVAYTPSELDPRPGPAFHPATDAGIQADLDVLRPYFNVLITYSCNEAQGMDRIVPIAAKNHFRVCLGIWDVKSVAEVACAVQLARRYPDTVLGVIVGNECLLSNRAKWEEIAAAISLVKAALPNVPVSTSEPMAAYDDANIRKIVDFHTPICHWVFQGGDRTDTAAAVAWLKGWIRALQKVSDGDKPLLIKEHGLPSGPAPFSPDLQAQYWTQCEAVLPRSKHCASVFFEAFCAPWKSETNASELSASESFWGAWSAVRKPLPVVSKLPHLR